MSACLNVLFLPQTCIPSGSRATGSGRRAQSAWPGISAGAHSGGRPSPDPRKPTGLLQKTGRAPAAGVSLTRHHYIPSLLSLSFSSFRRGRLILTVALIHSFMCPVVTISEHTLLARHRPVHQDTVGSRPGFPRLRCSRSREETKNKETGPYQDPGNKIS